MRNKKELEVFLKSSEFWVKLYRRFVLKYIKMENSIKFKLSMKRKLFHGLTTDTYYKISQYITEKKLFYYQKYRTWSSFKVLLLYILKKDNLTEKIRKKLRSRQNGRRTTN